MANVEMIGLLAAGCTKYHAVGSSRVTGDQLSRAELAGLLSGLGSMEMGLALAKYAGDVVAEDRLVIATLRKTAAIAVTERWDVELFSQLSNLSAVAVFEAVRPNRCTKCHGRGMVGFRVCGCCDGSGVRYLSGLRVADAIGVERNAWQRKWRGRYDQVFNFMQGIDANIHRVLRRGDVDLLKQCCVNC